MPCGIVFNYSHNIFWVGSVTHVTSIHFLLEAVHIPFSIYVIINL